MLPSKGIKSFKSLDWWEVHLVGLDSMFVFALCFSVLAPQYYCKLAGFGFYRNSSKCRFSGSFIGCFLYVEEDLTHLHVGVSHIQKEIA